MPIQFSQLYIADGTIVGFHDLTSNRQKRVIEVRTSTVQLIDLLCCEQHPAEKIVVHTSFRASHIHNTLVVCCVAFQALVETVLISSPFNCTCICLEKEAGRELGI